MQDFEKLGAFYLGRNHDQKSGETSDDLTLYDSKDLTTHAVCVGMTGSGKTGLGVALLEEAAIDGIPSIVIDPKGDMGNLLLGFPRLEPSDFEPWVDPGEAMRKSLTIPQYAASVADMWRNGLARWGQDGQRIARLQAAAEMAIYTPGSTAGLPLTVLRSFDAPPAEMVRDTEALGERIQTAVSGLLALLGIDADPLRSRESILLANILQRAWSEGRSLSIADLIGEIQQPPFDRLGVFDLESFFPQKERFGLAMTMNNLLASPGFAAWLEGEALDIGRLLYTRAGKPRIAILSIAHLSESERMFFVTILLNEVVAWMRSQPGTSSLRALLYMDEIFGYFPPSKEPPSKRPMLTLLKQARAYGLGVVLATQNPVDLDYKGLANTGTWFIGRLQTERDKLRVLDGLEGAMTGGGKSFDRGEMDAILSGLVKRVFLMNNVHDEQPVIFRTRWALSYLRGPLTREHIRRLVQGRTDPPAAPTPEKSAPAATRQAAAPVVEAPAASAETQRPMAPAGVKELYLARKGDLPAGQKLVYRPALGSEARMHFSNAAARVDFWDTLAVLAPMVDDEPPIEWEEARIEVDAEHDLRKTPEPQAGFSALPKDAVKARSYSTWAKQLASHLYQTRALTLWKNKQYKLVSKRGESEGEFRVRVGQAAKEKRDLAVEKLRRRYSPKLARLQEAIRKAEERIGKEEEQYAQSKRGSLISVGSTLLGALFSRKAVSVGNISKAGTAAKSVGRASKEKADIERAKRDHEAAQKTMSDLEAEFEEELAELQESIDPGELFLEELLVRPRKSDISVQPPALVWTPWRVDADGIATPAW